MKKKAFTLIELLVVIAIIALLLSIIVPALRKVKMIAKITLCGNNMKQVVLGLTTYASDNDGEFPYHPTMRNDTADPLYDHIRHRPFELNWHGSTNNPNGGPIAPPMLNDVFGYPFLGRLMSRYLPEAGALYCEVSDIKDTSPWPPPMSSSIYRGWGSVGQAYREGTFAPLHSTYTFLWRYTNTVYTPAYASYTGPKKTGDKKGLIIQDSLFYLQTTQDNLLWPLPGNHWYSSHFFKDSAKRTPYFGKDMTGIANPEANWPEVKLNAGYVDCHISRFDSQNGRLYQNINARLVLTNIHQ